MRILLAGEIRWYGIGPTDGGRKKLPESFEFKIIKLLIFGFESADAFQEKIIAPRKTCVAVLADLHTRPSIKN